MKKIVLTICWVVGIGILSNAQTRRLIGKVVDVSNQGIIAATVKVKGESSPTVTNLNGNFSIKVPSGNVTLLVSSIGFISKEVNVSYDENNVSIVLSSQTISLNEVVVTALGIQRQAKTLTYTTQKIDGNDLTNVKSTNILNSLNGKVAGLQVNSTSGGSGGSVRVVIRGDKSTRSSQPLYVIDGIPIINPTGGPDAGIYNGSPDVGDIISTLNPDDIENVNILKGASASALYGSQGSNGVIIITTKKGKTGSIKVNFSSGLTIDKASVLPKLQYAYAQTTAPTATSTGSDDSWGAKGDYGVSNGVNSFFQTGSTWINAINFSSGTEKSNSYFSYSNTINRGIMPSSSLKQNTVTFRQSNKMFNDKLIFDGTFIGSMQNSQNRLTPGVYFNPLTGLYMLPRGININSYKNYQYFSNSRYLNAQNWWNINTDKGFTGEDFQQNPYWVVYRNPYSSTNQNVYVSTSLKYLLNSWLTVQARGSVNNIINETERDIYATTQGTLADPNGQITVGKTNTTNTYGDILLLGNKNLNKDFNLTFTLGTSIQNQKGRGTVVGGALVTSNIFLESAIDWSNVGRRSLTNFASDRQIQSVFANVELGYKNKVYFTLSDRNDWSSTLAYTPSMKKGYNYPSFGANTILSDLFKMPSTISFAKLRVSYAIVGNDVNPYATLPLWSYNAGIASSPSSVPLQIPGYYLAPEKNASFEIGTEWKFLQNRLSFDFTWYKSNITNQYFHSITVAPSLGYGSNADVNGGNIQNTGIELMLSYKVVDKKDFSWTSSLNLSHNVNKVVALYSKSITTNSSADLPPFGLTGGQSYLVQGGSFGDLYGTAFLRDSKRNIVVDATTGAPQQDPNNLTYLGNPNPRYIAGWNNSLSIKNFTVGFLIDGKFGGQVLSLSEPYYDKLGVSQRSAEARDNGGVVISNAVTTAGNAYTNKIDARTYYQAIGGSSPIKEAYMYDATAIRLREVSVSYDLPLESKTIKNLRLSLIGSNLLFIKRTAPFDPELVAGVNPGGVGIDAFSLPSYRSMGLSLKCFF